MANKKVLAAELNQLLAETVILKWKAHNYHFNVTGIVFKQLHELFQEFYEDLEEAADEIGEQIRILGEYVDVNLETFSERSRIKQVEGEVQAGRMLKNLYEDNEYVIQLIESIEDSAKEAEAEDVLDFVVERHRQHSMYRYLFGSHIDAV